MAEVRMLKDLTREEVPDVLRAETYFDLETHPFAHRALFDRADVNCDGAIQVGDVVYLVNYLYRAGPPPPCPP